MNPDISDLPLDAIERSHIEALVTAQAEEGPRLELKRALATNDGRPDRWMREQNSIGPAARDDIAKEVVAFANAYGGILIIGVDETDNSPKRAQAIFQPLIPRVSDCAERLIQSLRSVIDPPLPMLEARGVEFADGSGVIVVRVGSSPSAPHGFGRPSNAYVRRGSYSEPLTMRDLQSVFYERRTRLERIAGIAEEQSSLAIAKTNEWRTGTLRVPDLNQPLDRSSGLLFQLSLISSEDLGIDNLPDRFCLKPMRFPQQASNNLVDIPQWTNQWTRGYRSVSHSSGYSTKLSNVSLRADGVITILLVKSDTKFHPAWFSGIIAQSFFMAEWIRRWLGRPDVEFMVEGKFEKSGDPAIPRSNGHFETWASIPWESAAIGPYSLTSRSNFPAIHDVIEREVWDLFGSVRGAPLKINWDHELE
jgi:hypothetical protein